MNLVIHAHTLKNEPLSQPLTGRFDVRGGTIGRSDTNTLSLPDPERHISRLHAEVWFNEGAFCIRNVGSANPIIVNGRPIAPGESAPLKDADQIVIGSYAMRVAMGQTVPQAHATDKAMDGRTVIAASATEIKTFTPAPPSLPPAPEAKPIDLLHLRDPMADDYFDDLAPLPQAPSPAPGPIPTPTPKPAPSVDPFADLFKAAPTPAPTPAPVQAARLPDDFDPFAPPPPKSPPAQAVPKNPAPAGLDALDDENRATPPAPKKPSPEQVAAFADLLGEPASPQASGLDGKTPPPEEDPLAGFFSSSDDEGAGPTHAAGTSKDPIAMFGDPTDDKAPTQRGSTSDGDRTPMTKGAFEAPPVPTPAVPEPPAPAAPPRPWYKFGSVTAAPVSAKSPPIPSPAPAPINPPPAAEPPAARPQGIMRAGNLMPETTMPAVRVSREVPFTLEPPKPMPPIPRPDGTTTPPPVPSPIPMPPLQSTPAPMPVAAPAPARAPVVPPVAAPAPATANAPAQPEAVAALWAAFCEGAGISVDLPQGLNPELMRVIGQVMQRSVEGTLKLVAVRAAAKQELRAQVTTIQSRNNNPLKFSPDAASAIEQLLQPPARGFMVGPAAVSDAMDDLLGHAIGTMAGMRAALTGVLQRFEPARLEGKLSGQSVIDTVLPMNRRAKLWELYLQHYERIQSDAEEDFHELFGKAFMRAYEDQLNRLDNDRRSAPPPPSAP